MKTKIRSTIAAALAGAAIGAASYAYLSDQVAVSYCVIRLDSSPKTGYGGPYIHENGSHSCAGVQGVERTAAGDLRIYNDPGGAIGACIAEEDETLVRLNLSAGCSGGAGTSTVSFWRDGKHVRIQDVNSGLANVWMLWVADPA